MRRYMLGRVGQLVLTLLIYMTMVYFLMQAMPDFLVRKKK